MLTVVVDPMVALAIHQERQMVDQFRHLPGGLPGQLAWHGSLSEDGKNAIRQKDSGRVRSGCSLLPRKRLPVRYAGNFSRLPRL